MIKDDTLFGTIAYDNDKHQEVLVLYTWLNKFADGEFTYAHVVSKTDFKKYSTDMDNLILTEEE